MNKETIVSKTVRKPLESHVVQVLLNGREHFIARVLWQEKSVREVGPFQDQDEAEAEADRIREEIFREKYATKK